MSWATAVLGGGLAGAATATRLADAGRKVVLIERRRSPHDKVCGEFLSGDAVAELRALGLEPRRLGAAPIDRVRLVSGSTQVEAALPFLSFGLSRRRLDEHLLQIATRAGVAVWRGRMVRGLQPEGAGMRLRGDDLDLAADAAVLATGKHDVRGWGRSGPSDMIGLKLQLRLAQDQRRALTRSCELFLFGGGYAGLLPIEDGIANLCFVVTRARFAALGRDWRAVVASEPRLASRLDRAQPLQSRPLAIAGTPYGHLVRADGRAPVYRVGDQAAVIPSFTGDGMAMALRSARLAAGAILAGESPERLHARLAADFRGPMALAGIVAALARGHLTRQLLILGLRAAPSLIAGIALRTRTGPAAA